MMLERTDVAQQDFDKKTEVLDPFEDDTPIVASCSLENPEYCDTCQ